MIVFLIFEDIILFGADKISNGISNVKLFLKLCYIEIFI